MTDKREQIMLLSVFIALSLAWAGIWGAWIQHPVPVLRQNAIELSRWLPFFDAVRFGGISEAPHLLRLTVSLVITGWAISMARIDVWYLRWGLRAFALVPILWMLPPYPNILSPVANGYEAWLVVLGLSGVGVISTVLWDFLNERIQLLLTGVCAVGTIIVSILAIIMVRDPFAGYYGGTLTIGWGFLLTVFASLIVVGLVGYTFNPLKAKQGA